jgi:hypothetical protein
MRFTEAARRLTGISCPVFGVSWNPGTADVTFARQVLTYLEDRRVLYAPWNVEVPSHCVDSVIEIRRFLTGVLGQLDDGDDKIVPHLRAMRAACRQFLATTDELRQWAGGTWPWMNGTPGWMFTDALGELRGVFGVHIAQLSAKFGIDIEDDLATCLPAAGEDDSESDLSPHGQRRRRPR